MSINGNTPTASDTKIPVFIGMTGHRVFRTNGDDLARLRASVIEALQEIRSDFKHTEFILLTSLAAGADQLVAEIAASIGMRYAVVLPMPRKQFLSRVVNGIPDFTEEQSANALRLMGDTKHCAFVYELPVTGDDETKFRETARFISDNSYAGIALWDGRFDEYATAGTGVAVRDALHGVTYRSDCFPGITVPETRPIYHICTPRVTDEPRAYDFMIRRLFPEPLLETGDSWFHLNAELEQGEAAVLEKFGSHWERVGQQRQKGVKENIRLVDRFNGDVSKYAAKFAAEPSKIDYSGLMHTEGTRADVCLRYFSAADNLAMIYQKRRQHCGIALILLAGVSYTFLNAFSDLFDHWSFLGLYIVLLIIAYVAWQIVDNHHLHNSFVTNRALAEGLRVQYFWDCADVKAPGGIEAQAQDYYLRRQKSRMEWIRYSLRAINLIAAAEYPAVSTSLADVVDVSDAWLGKMDVYNEKNGRWEYPVTGKLSDNGQSGYFLSSSLSRRDVVTLPESIDPESVKLSVKYVQSTRLNRWAMALLIVSGVIVGLTAIILIFLPGVSERLSHVITGELTIRDLLIFISGLLPIGAMVLREINHFMGFSDDVERYEWYYNIFKRAIVEIDECRRDTHHVLPTDEDKCSAIKARLFDIGKEALIENADWLMLNENRVPEVPSN